MGRWGFVLSLGLGAVLGTAPFTRTAHAGDISGIINALLAAQASVIVRKEDNTYADKLGLDPNATVFVQSGVNRCTGTFLNDTDVVTAGHCVDVNNPTGGATIEGIRSFAVVLADETKDLLDQITQAAADDKLDELLEKFQEENEPQRPGEELLAYYKRALSSSFSRDFAILKMPNGTGSLLGITKYPKFAAAAPAPGTAGTIVGYGLSNMLPEFKHAVKMDGELSDGGGGVKGWGSSQIAETISNFHWGQEEFVSVETPSKTKSGRAVGSHGDSGSFLYNDAGEAIGVLVAMTNDRVITSRYLKLPNPFIPLLPISFKFPKLQGWKPVNGYASVHSPAFTDALERAEELEVPEEIKASFPTHYLRLGLYASRDKNTVAYQAVGQYFGSFLWSVTLREIKDGKALEEEDFGCQIASKVCNAPDGRVLLADGTNFSLTSADGSFHLYMRQ